MTQRFVTTLDNCHEEPIHLPGSVQPHGVLLVLEPDTLIIRYVSASIARHMNFTSEDVLGKRVDYVVGREVFAELCAQQSTEDFQKINPLKIRQVNSKGVERYFDATITVSVKYLLLDLLPAMDAEEVQFLKFYHKIRQTVNDLVKADSLQQIFDRVVVEMRLLTGFDRVMLYQFDAEYNGEVVAESKQDHLNSFLQQHFPESDIPAQARALYLKNKVRFIADVHSTPSPIIPDIEPIDLSTSSLRSVSPIHIQYLKNMGVEASMSVSIIVEDRLWGLIACHHYTSRVVPFNVREAAAYLGMMVSYLITVKTRSLMAVAEAELQVINAKLVKQMANEPDFVDGLRKEMPAVLKMMNANGVAWKLDDRMEVYGVAPAEDQVRDIVSWIRERTDVTSIYYTDFLSSANAAFKDLSEIASGVLFLPISEADDQFLLWFRKEVIATKNWGGKPEKVIEFMDDGSHRLMPRRSFELWQENVRSKSVPWQKMELATAISFRGTILNYILLKAERLKTVNELLERKVKERTEDLQKEINERETAQKKLQNALKEAYISNRELEEFAYVASHDLQEPLRKIQAFGDRLNGLLKGRLDDRARDYLRRMISASGRMQLLIQDLLTFSRISTKAEPFAEIELDEVMENVVADLQILIEQTGAEIAIDRLGKIHADKNQMYRLFQNLVQNALKFSKKGIVPQVKILEKQRTRTFLVIGVEDNGIGFKNDYADRIFDLFERLHSRSAYEGTGLGLAICRKVVERHNGKIWAEGAENGGASFFVKLPLHQTTDYKWAIPSLDSSVTP